MKFENMSAYELGISTQMSDGFSRIIPRKIDVTRRIKYFVEETDWDQAVLKWEKWIDLCCGSVLGITTLYFGVICLKMLIR